MSEPINAEFLHKVVAVLAARGWSARFLSVMITDEGSGVVSGAQEHFAALSALSRQAMGDMPLPSRFCSPDDLDE